MKKQRGDAVLGFLLAVIAVLLVLSIFLHQKEQREWDAFATEHECVVVGKERGGMGVGFTTGSGGGGVGVYQEPDKTGYQCNDGVTYWR